MNKSNSPSGKFISVFQRNILEKKLLEDCSELYRQRINIMLLADEGKSQKEICQIVGCSSATARYWTQVARTGMADRWQDYPLGRPKTVNDEYLKRLQELFNSSPRDHGYAFGQWTVSWLKKHLAKEFGIEVSDRHFKRQLKKMGLSTRVKSSHMECTKVDKISKSRIQIADLTTT